MGGICLWRGGRGFTTGTRGWRVELILVKGGVLEPVTCKCELHFHQSCVGGASRLRMLGAARRRASHQLRNGRQPHKKSVRPNRSAAPCTRPVESIASPRLMAALRLAMPSAFIAFSVGPSLGAPRVVVQSSSKSTNVRATSSEHPSTSSRPAPVQSS